MKIWICRGCPPKLAKILKKISRKINGKLQNFETFHEILANFDLKKLILIKIKPILMEFWKDLIVLKESKKRSDKSLRVWAKNQLRFENFKICILKSQWKLIFTHFLSDLPGLLPFYKPLENKPFSTRNFFGLGVGGGKISPLPLWAHLPYNRIFLPPWIKNINISIVAL